MCWVFIPFPLSLLGCVKLDFLSHLCSSTPTELKKLMIRRKKVGKVFPVKISTMDAELEFSLDYKVIHDYTNDHVL